jgi:archaellum biogenesis protein FlaJ (TadC family)
MFGTQQIEDMASKPLFPLGKLFFWVSLVAAQVAGVIVGPCFGGHVFLLMLFLQMLTAVLAFLILYGLLALNIVDAIAHRNGMKMETPRVLRGVLYTVAIPLIMCALGFLVLSVQSHFSLHG